MRVTEVWEGTENTHLQSHHLKEWQSAPSDGEQGPTDLFQEAPLSGSNPFSKALPPNVIALRMRSKHVDLGGMQFLADGLFRVPGVTCRDTVTNMVSTRCIHA